MPSGRSFYLESAHRQSDLPRRIELSNFPLVIGRNPDCDVHLPVTRLSRRHALIERDCEQLRIKDLGSTNGTFVNHQPIDDWTDLRVGDILHLADQEFRLMHDQSGPSTVQSFGDTLTVTTGLPREFPLRMASLLQLLDQGWIRAFQQPICHADGSPFGHELLGRSGHPELTCGPAGLFLLAEALQVERRLSRLMRRRAIEAAARAGFDRPLFFNNHPSEFVNIDELLCDLAEIRAKFPDLPLVFEVHESAVTDQAAMAAIRSALKAMNIDLAYDDFGSGQARLLELCEVPPDYLKFDIAFIRDLERSDSPKYQVLATLNEMIQRLGVRTIAEGVETAAAARLCRELGIDYLQGFWLAKPQPIEAGC